MVRDVMVGVMADGRVAATAHVKTVRVKVAKDVMASGQNHVMQPVMAAVADGVVAADGVVPGGTAQIVQHRDRVKAQDKDRASASGSMQKANRQHWTLLPRLA